MTASSPRNPSALFGDLAHPEGWVPVLSHVYRTISLITNGNAALHKKAQAELARIGMSGSRQPCPSADAPDLFDMAAQLCVVDARTERRVGARLSQRPRVIWQRGKPGVGSPCGGRAATAGFRSGGSSLGS